MFPFALPFFLAAFLLYMLPANQKQEPATVKGENHFRSATWFSDYEAMKLQAKHFHIIHPFIYTLNGSNSNDGRIRSAWTKQQKKERMADLRKINPNILIVPTIFRWQTNSEKINAVIGYHSNPAVMEFHIRTILSEIREYGYDGIDIDYEGMECSQKDSFNQFIKRISAELRKEGKILSVSVHPKTYAQNSEGVNIAKAVECSGSKTSVDFRETWRGPLAHDYEFLGRHADQIKIMAYEKHPRKYKNPGPGPQAPSSWIEDILLYARDKIPAHKIFMAIPTYGYDWSLNCSVPVTSVYYSDASRLSHLGQVEQPTSVSKMLSNHPSASTWKHLTPFASIHADELYDDPSIWYRKNGCDHLAFYMNNKAFSEKIQILQKYNIGGFSFWQLTRDNDPKIQGTLEKIYSGIPAGKM